jgi:uncharacterized OB-fold protein
MDRTPIPEPSALTEGFWAAAREHRLVIQRCGDCQRYRHYPQYLCPECWSDNWAWTPVSGQGAVYSYAAAHKAFHPAWQALVPYTVATIELDEGVRLVSDLSAEDALRVTIGARVEVFFEDIDGQDFSLPRFRLFETSDGSQVI